MTGWQYTISDTVNVTCLLYFEYSDSSIPILHPPGVHQSNQFCVDGRFSCLPLSINEREFQKETSYEEKMCQPWIAAAAAAVVVWCKPSTSEVHFDAKVTRICFDAKRNSICSNKLTSRPLKQRNLDGHGWESTMKGVLKYSFLTASDRKKKSF